MLNPCCPASSEVTVIDTPDHTVLIVDSVQTLLPKYENCAGLPLPGGSQLATCADLALKQNVIQVQDDGVVVGSPGAATVYNFGAGLTSTLVGNVLTVTATASGDTDVSAISVDSFSQPDGSLRLNVSVTEDATVVTDFADVPYWTETNSGLVEKIDITEASQDNNLMLGNGVTSAAVVGVNGLDDQRGMTDRKTYAHIMNNWVIKTSRTYRVGVDARWPTMASVYNYLADRRFAAGAIQRIELPVGVTDASAGMGPMHPQHELITVAGVVSGLPLPAASAFTLSGIDDAAINADYAINRLILENKYPTILILPTGTTLISDSKSGYGSFTDITIRGELVYLGDAVPRYALSDVAIEGSLFLSGGYIETNNLYVIANSAGYAYRLHLENASNYKGLGTQFFQGGNVNIILFANCSALFAGATLVARGAKQNNLSMVTNADLVLNGTDSVFQMAGGINVIILGSSNMVYFGGPTAGSQKQMVITQAGLDPTGGQANLLISDGSTFAPDLNNPFTNVTITGANIGMHVMRSSLGVITQGVFSAHTVAHVRADQSDVSLLQISGLIAMDATPTNSIFAMDGSRVKTNGTILGQPSVPAIGTQGPTFAHIVV
jgi:hypothetical protein